MGAKVFVEEAITEGNNSLELVISNQFVAGELVTKIAGWSHSIPFGSSMEEELATAIGSTKSVPQFTSKKRYRPRVSDYELVCDRFNFKTPDKNHTILPNGDCASVSLYTVINTEKDDISRMYTVYGTNGRAKVVIPRRRQSAPYPYLPNTIPEIGMTARVDYSNIMCVLPNPAMVNYNSSLAGVASLPSTRLTKCMLETGESIILSTSTIRFVVPRSELFHSVATSIFGIQNELVNGMQESAKNSTLTTLPEIADEEVVVTEVKMTDTEVTALTCLWSRRSVGEVPHISCVYGVIDALIIRPQPMRTDIAQRLVNKGLNPKWTNVTTLVTLHHDPHVSKNTLSFNIPKILNESASVTRYFASLGNNFIMDWDGSTLYVVFDTVEILKGYEIPRWLFFTMIGVSVICIFSWFAAKLLIDERYWDSLYMTLSRELRGNRNDDKPCLHHFDPETFNFDGRYRLVAPTLPPQDPEDTMLYNDLTPAASQDRLMSD
ncbi:hypothetical protein BGW41_005949 [Actinomortierella wolfii]|nr:hypothetical protein BGW41_005949 [Actinomortierella wolfii]